MLDAFAKYPFESPFDFRKNLDTMHDPGRMDPGRGILPGEFAITKDWRICLPSDASEFMRAAAADLQDYFQVSMNVPIRIVSQPERSGHDIILQSSNSFLSVKRSFVFSASPQQILLSGRDERGCAMAVYFLEDLLNLREGPYLKDIPPTKKEPLFSPRIVHSGYGKTCFTPNYLRKIAHFGFDAIALYTNREQDLNFPELFAQAEAAGLDIYFYSKFANPSHPLDPEAGDYYDQTYGALFRRYPQARGILFVGESIRFPSRDPRVQPLSSNDFNKPSSASWPCSDYPCLIQKIQDSIRKVSPQADVVFWTYNWGWAPENDRVALIDSLPGSVSVNVNFALHDRLPVGKTVECALDYTLGPSGPSQVFISEARAASRRGLCLYAMANTAGKTWDFGTVPYIPAPMQWMKRFSALLDSREKYGLRGLLESHSYGWQPSVVSELAKWLFWSNSPSPASILRQLAMRESSEQGADLLLAAWRKWSSGMDGYPTPIEDQYGPCRVGPAYPLLFSPDMLRTYYIKMAAYPQVDQQIVFPWFRPVESPDGAEAAVWRVPAEIEYLAERIALWEEGIAEYRKVLSVVPEHKVRNLLRELALGCYIRNTLRTTRNVKRWWLLNSRVVLENDVTRAKQFLDEMQVIIEQETINVDETLPLLRFDSRLGYECAMGYAGDEWHLEWKKKLLQQLIRRDLPDYRKLLEEHTERFQ